MSLMSRSLLLLKVQLQVLVQRLTVGAAVTALGAYYWRIQRRLRAGVARASSGPCVHGREEGS